MYHTLRNKIINKNAKIAIVGLGYVGLPLAIEIASSGYTVLGIDINKEKIDSLNKGKSYIVDIEDKEIEKLLNYRLFLSNGFYLLSEADIVLVCVPTPLTKTEKPDVSFIESVVDKLKIYMKRGTLIVLESTTYPGSTEEIITRVLERNMGFEVGEDFFVCFSPERIDPANKEFRIRNTPKVIGGNTKKCLELGLAFYKSFVETVVPVSSIEVAEMSKLLENTFRSINIAFINEFALICDAMDINIWEVIEAAATKPYGFMPFYPGPGVGGHCLPIDPIYLNWRAKQYNQTSRFVELSAEINKGMPRHIVNDIKGILNRHGKEINNSKILIVGIAYKRNIKDLREAPSLKIMELLKEEGVEISYFDPFIPKINFGDETLYSIQLSEENLKEVDIVVILTDHSQVDYDFIVKHANILYDTKNITKGHDVNNSIYLFGGGRSVYN